jgi:hypothetical protein
MRSDGRTCRQDRRRGLDALAAQPKKWNRAGTTRDPRLGSAVVTLWTKGAP